MGGRFSRLGTAVLVAYRGRVDPPAVAVLRIAVPLPRCALMRRTRTPGGSTVLLADQGVSMRHASRVAVAMIFTATAAVISIAAFTAAAATSDGGSPRHRHIEHAPIEHAPIVVDTTSRDAVVTADELAWVDAANRAAFYAQVQRDTDGWVAGVIRAEQERALPTPRPPSIATQPPTSGSCLGNVQCFLACTIDHESRTSGGYSAVDPSGTYRGAYQFDQPTWNTAVAGAGQPEYVGVPANQAPAAVQDAAAAWLYGVAGNRPWGGRC